MTTFKHRNARKLIIIVEGNDMAPITLKYTVKWLVSMTTFKHRNARELIIIVEGNDMAPITFLHGQKKKP